MNIAIINLKDILRFLIKIIIIIILVISTITVILQKTNNYEIKYQTNFDIFNIKQKTLLECIDSCIALARHINNKNENKKKIIMSNEILNMGLGMINKEKLEASGLNINENELSLDDVEELKNQLEEIPEEIVTEQVAENNIAPNYTNSYGSVNIDNQSDYNLTEDMLKPNTEITNKKDILIYHTHTCESYTPTEKYSYEMTGNYRTTDLNYSVARIGTEFTNFLQEKNFNVTHNTTYHDYPAYSGSYARALETIQNLLTNKNPQLVFDLHRDAIGSSSQYAPTVKINDEYAAQLMFVIGTDGGGLEHPNWLQNLQIAIKIQEEANQMYPGLFRSIILRNSRYNQHLASGASIIEVGATGNTIEQCIFSMNCLTKVLEKVCE